jgi:hypothetical protein
MKKLLIILLSFLPYLVFSQATTVSLGTSSTGVLSLSHNTWTKVDPNVTITANGTINGFRVQISQAYTSGASGDQLRSTVTLPSGISVSTFNTTTGILVFNGTTTAANWQTILRGVEFKSTSSSCYTLQRRVTFVAGTVFYNPLTEHFYEYVAGNTSWTNSYTVSAAKSYFGRAGYLATIMSEAENNFIWKLMSSDAWFGASDDYSYINTAKGSTVYANQSAAEGKWHWVTGPEKGQNFTNGNVYAGPTLVTGMYHKWAGGEPNGTSEAFGQFYSSNNGQWNDLANSSLPGYICEYGDMPGDITSSTTILTRSIEISGASSGYISGGDINVCSGSNSTTLTLNGYTGSIVRWESSFDNFFTAGTTISSTSSSITVSNLTKTTYYRAIVNSSSPQSCSNLPTSSVFLSVKPTKSGSVFAVNNSICAGGQVELTLSGQQGNVNKWQRSTDNVNWTDISNTTTSLTQTLNTAGTYYYRVQVQTTNCGSAVNSDSKTITVTSGTPPVGGSVSSANHSTTSNSGTLTLSGYSGTIVKWQRSTNDGVTWTDITNTNTTYSYTNITAKTLFRVQLQSGTCGFAYSTSGIVNIVYTISGTITLPASTTLSPMITISLYKVVGSTETLVKTDTLNSNGTYSFDVPESGINYKIVPYLVMQGITLDDFNPAFNEVMNMNTPNNTTSGLHLNSGKKWKAADISRNGFLDLGDAFLIAAHITNLVPINRVLWFTAANYDSLTQLNYGSVNAVDSFSFSSVSSSVTQNIKYCILGDVNLSHSSN